MVRVGKLLDALDLGEILLDDRREGEEPEVDHPRDEPMLVEQLLGSKLTHDRELHHECDSAVVEQLRKELKEVVDEVSAPVIERPVAAGVLEGSTGIW